MDDEVFCLFVTLVCVLTLAMPAPAQPLFAGFAFAITLAAKVSADPDQPAGRRPQQWHDRHDVTGG